MIVDDSPDDADQLSKNLRVARFMLKATRVTDAVGMQSALEKGKCDLVVCEHKLKNFDANLALDTLKRINPALPLIIFTRDLNDKQTIEIMDAGARDVVLKSRPARIIPAIRRELDVAAARKEYRRMVHAAKAMEDKHRAMVEGGKDAICYCHDGMHIDVNRLYLDMFGYRDIDELEVIPVLDLIDKEDQDRFKTILRKLLMGKDVNEPLEFSARRKDDSHLDIEIQIAKVNHKDEDCLQLTVIDITKRKAAENRLKYLSQRDPLTGLYNRHHFTKLLQEAVEKAKSTGKTSALIYLDLYGLKDINAELGYTAGDRALLKIAKMFRDKLGKNAIIARVGGDEFSILLGGKTLKDANQTTDILKKLFKKTLLSEKGKKHDCDCTHSIAMVDGRSGTAQDIMAIAGKECDKARPKPAVAATTGARPIKKPASSAQNNIPVQKSEKSEPMQSTQAATPAAVPTPSAKDVWKGRIEKALTENQFKLLYQPVINLHGGADEFFEVLVRMVGEDGELIPPGEFIQAAEETGLMTKIDYWVTEHAIKSLATLHTEGRIATFFVNLSKATLDETTYPEQVKSLLDTSAIDGQHLVFEVDESDISDNSEEVNKEIASRLTRLGSSISIDNCGLALDIILNLPRHSVKYIKIDKAVVEDAASNIDKEDSLIAMLAMAIKLEVKSVAKGIEDAHSLTALWKFGFEYVQGHYFQHADEEISYDFTPEDEATLSSEEIQTSTWTR